MALQSRRNRLMDLSACIGQVYRLLSTNKIFPSARNCFEPRPFCSAAGNVSYICVRKPRRALRQLGDFAD